MGKEKYEKMVMEVVELKDDIIMASLGGSACSIDCQLNGIIISGGGCSSDASSGCTYSAGGGGYVETNPSSSGYSCGPDGNCGDAGTICNIVSTGGYECEINN